MDTMMKEEYQKRKIEEAKSDLAVTEAMLILARNNRFACTINIRGLSVSLCNNGMVIPALVRHKQKILKCIEGEENEWE